MEMSSAQGIRESRKRIFASVFPSSPLTTERPTPVVTPDPAFVGAGQAFGVPPLISRAQSSRASHEIAAEHTKWNRAWHTVTTFLTLPKEPIHANLGAAQIRKNWLKRASLEVSSALELVVSRQALVDATHTSTPSESIVEWYLNEVRRHYLAFVRPSLITDHAGDDAELALSRILRTLELAHHIYLYPLLDHILPALSNPASKTRTQPEPVLNVSDIEATFRRDLQAIIVYSLPPGQISSLFAQVLIKECRIILGISSGKDQQAGLDSENEQNDVDQGMSDPADVDNDTGAAGPMQHDWHGKGFAPRNSRGSESIDDPRVVNAARQKVLRMFRTLKEVGLGQERGHRVFAEVMNKIMSEHVETAYADQWEAPSQVIVDLKEWIENYFARLVVEVLHCLQQDESGKSGSQSTLVPPAEELVGLEDVQRWQEMGIGRLGRLRVKQLFDIVVDWDASMGAVQDLKTYITSPATRTYLTTSLVGALLQRLLHPGASTMEILQAYISLIRTFHLLDPKGVLLDKVARPIRRYLRDRDDTVNVIVAGLLATVDEEEEASQPTEDILTELAIELNRASDLSAQAAEDDADLDWDDLEWVPDPIDAGPEYRKSKGSDVVGSLISLFDSKDVFVKELQAVMGERLLKNDLNIEREVRLLELLKLRFGEGALQACEVMLRDVRESKIMDRNIRDDQNIEVTHRGQKGLQEALPEPPALELHTKILSYLFWPELQEGTFRIPEEVATLQERYERGFEKLKQSRKLSWLQTLGQVSVELELEDRVVQEEVQTWQASVIHAFQHNQNDAASSTPVTRTVSQLMTTLEMDEGLVRNALGFWVAKAVLQEIQQDELIVLETLDVDPATGVRRTATDQPASSAATSFVKSADQVAHEKLQVYWQFIQGMLTNGGPMPLSQIVMMLKFTVPGGFPFGDEDLRQFLLSMCAQDKLEMEGDRYKIKR